MSKEQKLIDQLSKFYCNHPYFIEFVNDKWTEMSIYGTSYYSDEDIKNLIKKIDIENEVAKYFRAN